MLKPAPLPARVEAYTDAGDNTETTKNNATSNIEIKKLTLENRNTPPLMRSIFRTKHDCLPYRIAFFNYIAYCVWKVYLYGGMGTQRSSVYRLTRTKHTPLLGKGRQHSRVASSPMPKGGGIRDKTPNEQEGIIDDFFLWNQLGCESLFRRFRSASKSILRAVKLRIPTIAPDTSLTMR